MRHTMSSRVGVCLGCAVVILILLFASIPASAQESGTILGVVKDASGGVVPGASITITNEDTGQARTIVTESDGSFRAPALLTGRYTVKIEKAGFRPQTQTGLLLTVAQELVVNAAMEIGSSAQEVVVTGEAPLVDTTNSQTGSLVNEQSVAELPLNGRNWTDLTLMQPGVNYGASAGGSNSGTAWSSNGASTRSNNIMLDGAIMQNIYGTGGASISGSALGVDGIKEYKLITAGFGAEYGMSAGSQTTIVSKGGTNQWHGDAFEYLRNSSLDARNFFDLQPSTPQLNGKRIPEYQRNQFGGSFGGPIRKDKTFFYAVFEGLIERKGVAPAQVNEPAAGCRSVPAGGQITNAICPQLALPASIPSITVGPYSDLLMTPMPLPNTPSLGPFAYAIDYTQPTNEYYGQIRLDHTFSTADTAFVRYTVDDTSQAPFLPPGPPTFTDLYTSRSQYATLGENHIFSSTVLNSFRLSYDRTSPVIDSFDNLGGKIIFEPGENLIGNVTITGFGGYSPKSVVPDINIQNIVDINDDVFWSKGKHSIKFGILINHYYDKTADGEQAPGRIAFNNLAQFIAGFPSLIQAIPVPGTTNPSTDLTAHWIYDTYGFYFQDDIRMSSRVTLNAGLRYEFNTVPRALDGQEYTVRNFLVDTVPTHGPVFANTSLKNFSPRLGFAWDVFGNGKMAVRGGAAIYYDVANYGTLLFQHGLGTPPLSATNSVTYPTCVLAGTVAPTQPICTNAYTIPFTFTANQLSTALQTASYYNPQPTLYQVNLTVERQLPGSIDLSVGYVSTRGVNLWSVFSGNPRLPTTTVNGIPYWTPLSQACPTNVNLCRINPAWGGITTASSASYDGHSGSESWYNGLQVNVTKKITHGLQFQASYTYSRTLDTTQGEMAGGDGTTDSTYPFNRNFDKGPTEFNLTNNFRFNSLYYIPGIKSDGLLSKFTNGWWVGDLISIQSGFPFTPYESASYNSSGDLQTANALSGDRVSYVTAANLAQAQAYNKNAVPFDPNAVLIKSTNQWFNPNMFFPAPAVNIGGVLMNTVGNVPRGSLIGPDLNNWNVSINKDTAIPRLGEAGKLQFRAEFFNFFNKRNLGLPATAIYGPSGPVTTVPQITATNINNFTSRQVQLSLKLLF